MEYHFRIEDAIEYGVNEAILINNFRFWVAKNKANKKNFFDGRTWTYNSVEAFTVLFPFWTPHQIRHTIKSLKKQQVIITGNYSELKYDRTTWFAFKDEEKLLKNNSPICEKSQFDLSKITNRIEKNHKPIPYNKPYNKPDNIILPFHSLKFSETWNEFKLQREMKRKKVSPIAERRLLKDLSQYDEQTAIAMIEQSITNDYQGIFPIKKHYASKKSSPTANDLNETLAILRARDEARRMEGESVVRNIADGNN